MKKLLFIVYQFADTIYFNTNHSNIGCEYEKENIEHYLFDIVSLNDDYTLYDYQKDGRKIIDKFPEHMTQDGYVFSHVMQY